MTTSLEVFIFYRKLKFQTKQIENKQKQKQKTFTTTTNTVHLDSEFERISGHCVVGHLRKKTENYVFYTETQEKSPIFELAS